MNSEGSTPPPGGSPPRPPPLPPGIKSPEIYLTNIRVSRVIVRSRMMAYRLPDWVIMDIADDKGRMQLIEADYVPDNEAWLYTSAGQTMSIPLPLRDIN